MSGRGCTLVTGATQGIGRAVVDALRAQDERVVGIARRPDPGFPGPLVLADLADPAATQRALAEITAAHDIHSLVNNAGFNQVQALGDITAEAAAQIMAINVHAAIACTQAVLPAMRAAGRGRIVNMSSRSALGRVDGSVYGAAKAALIGLTRSWALELAGCGITVNCVAPGPVDTEMFARNNPPELPRAQALRSAVPMKRLGRVEEVAGAVLYFLSPGAAFTTGQTLFVCGGSSISQIHL